MSSIRTWNHRHIGQHSNQLDHTNNTYPIEIRDESRLTRVESSFTSPKSSFFRFSGWKKVAYSENDRKDQSKIILQSIPTTLTFVEDPSKTQPDHVDHDTNLLPIFHLFDTEEHSDVSSLSSSGTASSISKCRSPPTPVNLPRPTMVTSEIPQRPLIASSEPIVCPIDRRAIEIEIHPGVFGRMRGAEETTQAIENDFFLPCKCFACQQTVFHIQDADFVLCPDCRTIQPVGETTDCNNNGGVGLGFKMAELLDVQQQIVKRRWHG